MNKKLDPHIIELESKIQILERENETLSAKAEENLLLNRAFEEINVYDDIDSLMLNTLESISVLLNIQFSGIFDYVDHQYQCISSYALFSKEDTVDIQFSTSGNINKKLSPGKAWHLSKSDNDYTFIYPGSDFFPDHILLISLDSEIKAGRFFVFANDNNGQQLSDRIPLFIKVIRIISAKLERIYYQNELLKLNEELEQKIELRTAELHQQNQELIIAKEKAEESDRLKTSFLQNISHEIRTPMNAIMGFSSLLAESFGDKAKLERFAKLINQRSKDLLDIISDILEISKIESGLVTINIGRCKMKELFTDLKSSFSEYQERLNKQHLSINFTPLESEHTEFRTDASKLKQILINLINNALKFTDSGSIEISYQIEGDTIIFSVTDTGIGISSADQQRIFDRFYQVYNRSRMNEGNGLGLAIVHGLVNLLGGQIWLESKLSEGSKFSFSLPYEPCFPVETEEKSSESRDDILFSDTTVLIVEDDKYNAEYIREILIPTGVKILTAGNGNDAVEMALSQPVDLVLMDIRLPDINGYEAKHLIKKHKPHLRFIAQTAYAAQGEKEKAMDAGFIDYISKPTNKNALLAMLYKHLGRHKEPT